MVKKNCEVWRKMGLFGPDSDPANQLLLFLTALNFSPNRPHSTAKFALLKIKFLQFRLRIKI
jgi:hypothetical protein